MSVRRLLGGLVVAVGLAALIPMVPISCLAMWPLCELF